MSLLQTAAIVGSLAASVSAHGIVQGIIAGGKWYSGYNPSFQYQDPPPTVIGWSTPEDQSLGFIDPNNYTSSDIICHLGATPGGASAKVEAGSVVELQWSVWPDSHHGPVLDYLANCHGDCSKVDKTSLEFFKIDEGGLVDDSTPPGTWASDQLIANNNSWVVTIPKSIAPGNYVLRHEIIALHSAGNADGAQNYPQCINLEITGSGTDAPAGESAEKFYTPNDPGILVNIYTSLATYKIPGPSLIAGAVSMKQTQLPINGAAPTSASGGSASAAGPSSGAAAGSSVAAGSSAAASYPAGGQSSAAAGSSAAPASSVAPSASFGGSVSFSFSPSSSAVGGGSSGIASYPAGGSSSAAAISSSAAAPGSSGAASYPAGASSSGAAAVSSSAFAGSSAAASYSAFSGSSAAPISGFSSFPAGASSSVGPIGSSSGPCTTTVTVSASASASLAPSGSSAGAISGSSFASASASAPASSAAPSGYPGGSPVPKNATLKELMEWCTLVMKSAMRKAEHQKDFRRR